MNPAVPRGISGRAFMRTAEKLGYVYSRSNSTHVVFTINRDGEKHICIPDKKEISVGTLNDLLADMAEHLKVTKAELISQLFGKH